MSFTSWFMLGVFGLIVIVDIVLAVFVPGGTISEVTYKAVLKHPQIGHAICLLTGFLLGHLCWGQKAPKGAPPPTS